MTPSTRPPEFTTAPSRSRVPAWNTWTPVNGSRLGEARDRMAGVGRLRVGAARDDHASRSILVPRDLLPVQVAPGRRLENGYDVGLHSHQDGLGFGVAEIGH